MARTLIARLPRLFQLVLESLGKNPIAADIITFGIIYSDFLFFILKMVWYEAILMRTHNIPAY